MKTIAVKFKNKPLPNGSTITFVMQDCLIASSGSPTAERPQITIHLPKTDLRDVNGSFVEYDGYVWHVRGTTAAQMDDNIL